MPSPEFVAEPVAHVERTADPAVLRWRCSAPSLAALPDGPRRPDDPEWAGFGDALVEVRAGTVEVRLPAAEQWAQTAHPMHTAMLDALRRRAPWLFEGELAPGEPAPGEPAPGELVPVIGCDVTGELAWGLPCAGCSHRCR
mgnify:CR=1 FL=1